MRKASNGVKKILIIEDDSAIVDIYKIIFKKASFEAEFMSSGQEAMDRIKAFVEDESQVKPDVVLLDLILPDMNGIEVLKAIRNTSATKDIIVFILTNQEKTQLTELSEARPDKIIIKANTSPTQLLEIIEKQLQ